MIDNMILDAIKKYIKDEIASKTKLQKAQDENTEIEYVHPYVDIGYLPPKNFLPEGYDVPCIIVGEAAGEDTDDDANLHIKLTFATYGAGTYDENNNFIPDMYGYKDLLNIMTRTRIALTSNPIIEKTTIVKKPIKWAMYDEQPWPYWYGYMTFDVSLVSSNMINTIEKQYL